MKLRVWTMFAGSSHAEPMDLSHSLVVMTSQMLLDVIFVVVFELESSRPVLQSLKLRLHSASSAFSKY